MAMHPYQVLMMSEMVLCACGCETAIPAVNKSGQPATYAKGHNRRGKLGAWGTERNQFSERKEVPAEAPTCACGCGTVLPPLDAHGRKRTYAQGHLYKGKHLSAETRAKISATRNERFALLERAPRFWERFEDPAYRTWRAEVFARDADTCQDCGYQVNQQDVRQIDAHHILPWSTHEDQRHVVSNGITLCRVCHMARHGITVKPTEPIPCGCGCGTLISPCGANGKPRQYVNHHASRGRKASDETRARISAAKKGIKPSPEQVAKSAASRRGLKRSIEAIENTAAANRGRKYPKVAEWNRTRERSQEERDKISAANTGKVRSDEVRAQMSATRKGVPKSAEHRAALTKARQERAERERMAKYAKSNPAV